MVSLGAALILIALLPAFAALVGRQWNDAKPSRWSNTRPNRFRNPSGNVTPSTSTPRFPAPITAVHAHPSNRTWTTNVYAHTVGNPAVRLFSTAEAKSIQFPQPHPKCPNPTPHVGLAAAQRLPSYNGKKPGHSPTMHSRIFDLVQKDYSNMHKTDGRMGPLPKESPPLNPHNHCSSILHAACRSIRAHTNSDVFRHNFMHPDRSPKSPHTHEDKYHVIYLLYSSSCSYVGYTRDAKSRCEKHMTEMYKRAKL